MQKYILFLMILLVSSCASVKQNSEIKGKSSLAFRKTGLNTLSINADIQSIYHGESNSGACKILISNVDSLSLTLTGPFGITFGKLFAQKEHFVFFNTFNNEVLEGKPTSNNLKQVAFVPLEYTDLLRLVRNETPDVEKNYILTKTDSINNEIIFVDNSKTDYTDKLTLNYQNYSIKKYERYLKDEHLLFEVQYKDYKLIKNVSLPLTLEFRFSDFDSKLIINNIKYVINFEITKPFSFTIPANIKRFNLD